MDVVSWFPLEELAVDVILGAVNVNVALDCCLVGIAGLDFRLMANKYMNTRLNNEFCFIEVLFIAYIE